MKKNGANLKKCDEIETHKRTMSTSSLSAFVKTAVLLLKATVYPPTKTPPALLEQSGVKGLAQTQPVPPLPSGRCYRALNTKTTRQEAACFHRPSLWLTVIFNIFLHLHRGVSYSRLKLDYFISMTGYKNRMKDNLTSECTSCYWTLHIKCLK